MSQRQTDLSESPWFYLVILAVLVLEQAMAVHLSFHLKGSEAACRRGGSRSREPLRSRRKLREQRPSRLRHIAALACAGTSKKRSGELAALQADASN